MNYDVFHRRSSQTTYFQTSSQVMRQVYESLYIYVAVKGQTDKNQIRSINLPNKFTVSKQTSKSNAPG